MSEGNILVVLHQSLFPLKRGDNKRIVSICNALRHDGWTLDLIELLESKTDFSSKGKINIFRDVKSIIHPLFESEDIASIHCSIAKFEHECGFESALASEYTLPFNFKSEVRKKIWTGNYDFLLLASSECLPLAVPIPQHLKILFCPCDIQSVTFDRMEEAGIRTGKDIKKLYLEEMSLFRYCDLIAAVSRKDAVEAEKFGGTNVCVVPLSFEISNDNKSTSDTGTKNIFYIGTDTPINRQALEYFLEEIWPDILSRSPDAKLMIAGNVCKSIKNTPPSVKLLGLIEDLTEFYAETQVVIAPIKVKTGIYVKIAEAMAHGKAVVATPEANFGLEIPEDIIAIADTPRSFADKVLELLNSPERVNEYGLRAREYINKNFSDKIIYNEFLKLIKTSAVSAKSGHLGRIEIYSATENADIFDHAVCRIESYLKIFEQTGIIRFVLYGAGKHSVRILQKVKWGSRMPSFIIDDNSYGKSIMGLKIEKPEYLLTPESDVQAVILSSDVYENVLADNIKNIASKRKIIVLKLYS